MALVRLRRAIACDVCGLVLRLAVLQGLAVVHPVAVEAHRLSLKNPSKTVAEYLSTLESHGLVRTVAELRLALL